MCFAAKWVGERGVEFWSDHDQGHDAMIQRAWDLLDEADAALHYNGTSFDIKHLNREFMEHGLKPPAPYKQIDLYKTARTKAKFISNKLAFVGPRLGLKGKVKHEGFGLWLKCMDGDDLAWARMRRYNVRDVTELEDLYGRLLPWITNHPSRAALQGEDVCPRCGSNKLHLRGYVTTASSRYQRFQCQACGGWGKIGGRDAATTVTQVAA